MPKIAFNIAVNFVIIQSGNAIIEITPEVMLHVISCLETHSLPAMDAIHLGCAEAIAPDQFVSSDQRQIQAARAIGLTVVEV